MRLLPTLLGRFTFRDFKRQLKFLPSCLGGFGIIKPCVSSALPLDKHDFSLHKGDFHDAVFQPVNNEHYSYRSANNKTDACLDVRAQRIWGIHHQQAYFDARVFNPLAASNHHSTVSRCFQFHDHEKHQIYEQCVCDAERGSFTPPCIFCTWWCAQIY